MNYFTVTDVMKIMGIAQSTAYKLINQLNKELKSQGKHVFAGRVSKKYFYERTCYEPADN